MTSSPESENTFLFADLAGFTALTEAHGDEEAAKLAAEFAGAVAGALPEGAEAVKTLGDAVMVRVPDPHLAVRLGVDIVSDIGGGHGFLSVRVGMHTGSAVRRDGDWFGAAVNTAARVSALARGGEVLATEATCRAAGAVDGVELRKHGRHELRNVAHPVAIFRVVPVGEKAPSGLPIDPVCRMEVDPSHSAGTLVHEGVEYHFCSLDCAQEFAATHRLGPSGGEQPTHRRSSIGAPGKPLRRLLPLVQGGSYLGFALWSLLARDHYRVTHGLRSDDWVLNAHGAWLSVVGGTLLLAGVRDRFDTAEIRALAAGSALALAANDAALWSRIPAIYRGDLAYESLLAAGWLLSRRAARRDAD